MTAPFLALAFGPWEIGAILLIVLLLFGSRIPSMARNLGSGVTEFKRGLKSGDGGDSDKDRASGSSAEKSSASSKDA
jgi:sec-independent protein translocase protein TatA